MRLQTILLSLLSIFIIYCSDNKANGADSSDDVVADTISSQDAFTLLSLTEEKLNSYIAEHHVDDATAKKMREFYKNRDYQYAWFTEDGPAEHTRSFWNLHQQYLDANRDSTVYSKQLHNRMDEILNDKVQLSATVLATTEIQLTEHFFEFTKYAYGGTIDPSKMQWHIPKSKIDAIELLDSLTASGGENMKQWEPVNEQFQLLQKKLVELHKIQKEGKWRTIELGEKKVLREGDSAAAVVDVKHNLAVIGDYTHNDISTAYTPQLADALRSFQRRYGLKVDGVVGPEVTSAMNTPLRDRIEQVMINMERMRWLPADEEGRRAVVNIPDFKLHVYDGDKEVMNMAVVVGKVGARTVIFSDKIEYVVFAPYWNIPRSIVREEILPAMDRNSNYLADNHMEITDRRNGLPVIRQKPGPWNALGRVKFLFPNRYSIYLHDTPAKSLFERSQRTFSHGCIRIERPADFAAFLLQNKEDWDRSRIESAMNRDSELWVTLDKKVPVKIVYFTAWVDKNGALNFRDDIYGHDARMAKQLFED